MSDPHPWKFFRAGGFDQVRIDSGADLLALEQLDQKLWAALACPTTGLEFDTRTLALIDSDKDGRIRPPELIAAVKWALARLKRPEDLLQGSADLPLTALNDQTPEGREILNSAREILANLGKSGATAITVEDTLDTAKIFVQTRFNGDGVVPADAADDAATKAVIEDIIACFGAEKDRSGKPGINQAKVDQFFAEAQAYLEWYRKAEAEPGILPLGPSTGSAVAAWRAVKAKGDDYFARCRLAEYDARAVGPVNRDEKEYLAFAAKELTMEAAEIAALPLAQAGPGRPLPLSTGVNPAWAAAMERFAAEIVRPLLPENTALREVEWFSIGGRFSAYETWAAAKPVTKVEKLGLDRIRSLGEGAARIAVEALIARDKALEPEASAIEAVERLARYYRDLEQLLHNFVSFSDFYTGKRKAIFQAGTLYLDQRSCQLCLVVGDAARHSAMGALSGTYLAYCDCVRKGSNEQMQIVAAFTGGESDNLMVGRNGVFYDRRGRDWDATITKLVDNPISIRQGIWSPYKKAARLIREQMTKQAAAADEAVVARIATGFDPASAKAAPPAAISRFDPGLIAALGVGAAGLGGMVGGIVSGFLGLKWLMPLGALGILLAISGPSVVVAWLKLRRRNLGPILDANGWAVNTKARINVAFGDSLTQIAQMPPGAATDLIDPFADIKRPWAVYAILAIILSMGFCYYAGVLDTTLPVSLQSPTVLKKWSPNYKPVANSSATGDGTGAVTNAPAAAPAK